MQTEVLELDGPIIFKPDTYQDSRGFFEELWNNERYEKFGIPNDWKQINHSYTSLDSLRGLHYRDGEAKLVTVVRGKIWDVVVDIRPDSNSFGKWAGVFLDGGYQLYVPSGFAHGFQNVCEEGSHVIYLTTEMYNKSLSKGLLWNDPLLKIEWPRVPSQISEQDQANPTWNEYVKNLDSGRNRNARNSIL